MSLLSALFCCFDTEDKPERPPVQKLTSTQTNLQRALTKQQTQLASTQQQAVKKAASQVPLQRKTNAHQAKPGTVPEGKSEQQQHNDSKDYHRKVESKHGKNELEEDEDELEDEEDGLSTDMKADDDVSIQTDTTDTLDLTKILPDQATAESGWLLNPQGDEVKGRKCLVLDLDETLVHSSFKYVRHCDFVIPVDIENQIHNVYVIKRPGVDQFLKRCGELFEVVIFTASVSRYGDPLLDILDPTHTIHHRLFRDSCYNYDGNYIKNLSQMGRPLKDLIIIDNSPASYIFHPQHAVPVSSWFSDTHDCELSDLLPFLEDLASKSVDDVGLVLDVNI